MVLLGPPAGVGHHWSGAACAVLSWPCTCVIATVHWQHLPLFAGVGHHWERVLSLLDDMAAAGVEWDAFTLSALLSACQAGGKWEQALQWFERAQQTPGEAGLGWRGMLCCNGQLAEQMLGEGGRECGRQAEGRATAV